MEINVIAIVVICILASLAWWANETLNTVPVLKNVVKVVIVVVAVLLLLNSMGLGNNLNSTIRIN